MVNVHLLLDHVAFREAFAQEKPKVAWMLLVV